MRLSKACLLSDEGVTNTWGHVTWLWFEHVSIFNIFSHPGIHHRLIPWQAEVLSVFVWL